MFRKLIFTFFYPIRMILGLIISTSSYRFLWVKFTKLGHLLIEIDGLLKDVEIGSVQKRNWILLYDRSLVANPRFIELLPPFIHPVQIPASCIDLTKLLLKSNISSTDVTDYCTAMYSTAKIFSLNSMWGERPPTISLPKNWATKKDKFFDKLGLPRDQKYVCIHARDSNSQDKEGRQHSGRNVEIFTFSKMVHYLSKKNIKVFRMGDPSMPFFESSCDSLYDYAHMDCRDPALDLMLSANCMFFVGTSSGAYYMATIFNRPVVAVGVSLPFNFCPSGFERDFGIPKLFRKIDTKELCSFKEIFANGLSECRTEQEILKKGYELVENTEDEIEEVVTEMFERLNGNWYLNDFDEELQHKAKSLIKPGSYTYGSKSRCGTLFLRKYSHLVL